MTQQLEAVKLALEGGGLYEITGRIEDIDKAIIHRSALRQAIEQEQHTVVAWDTKEMLLQSWLPLLKDALQDVRSKENAAAEETLYELYVEMNQQTLKEKVDTLSEMRTEDLLSSTVAELLATRKRLADTENILCRHHFEQAQKQEPVAWMQDSIELYVKDFPDKSHTIPLYTSPPQRQPEQEPDLGGVQVFFPVEQAQKQSTVNQFHPDYANEAVNEMTLMIQRQAMRIEELEQAQKQETVAFPRNVKEYDEDWIIDPAFLTRVKHSIDPETPYDFMPTMEQVEATLLALEVIPASLFTSPPQRQPLTDEQLEAMFGNGINGKLFKEIARYTEAAHGIKGEA